MLKKLNFTVTFPSTKRTFEGQHEFDEGLTAITGPNERGKSLRLEMIRYALFGTKALRGAAGDYKNLKVDLEFEVNGETYRVSRKASQTLLTQGKTSLATGTKPVNAKIREILGYDMRVFDVANACQQGEVEALSAMKPQERKQMVDQTIGLNALDEVSQQVKEKANAEKRAAEALEKRLVAPEEPSKPANYQPVADLEQEKQDLHPAVREYFDLRGWLNQDGPVEPQQPTCPVSETVEQLREQQQRREAVRGELHDLQAQRNALRPTDHSQAQIDRMERQLNAYRLWQEWLAYQRQNPKPTYNWSTLNAMEQTWDTLDAFAKLDRLNRKIAKLRENGHHQCPSCGHQWAVEQEQIDTLTAEIEQMGWADTTERPAEPELDRDGVEREKRRLQAWVNSADERARFAHAEETPDPGIDEGWIAKQRAALEDNAKVREVDPRIKELENQLAELPDRADDLKARERYDWEMASYQERKTQYDTWLAEKRSKEARAKEILPQVQRFEEIDTLLVPAREYEQALSRYQDAMADYLQRKQDVDAHRDLEDQYTRSRKAITDLRAMVKQHLVPSLNKVASMLISQMTMGERNKVQIDEDFNIEVDGQPLNTLSGSGKAVANLSIRIALGQVLTNKVFSVFIGDEIDASMDQNRAGGTAQTLRNLKNSISQIVLVTHKHPNADHILEL